MNNIIILIMFLLHYNTNNRLLFTLPLSLASLDHYFSFTDVSQYQLYDYYDYFRIIIGYGSVTLFCYVTLSLLLLLLV